MRKLILGSKLRRKGVKSIKYMQEFVDVQYSMFGARAKQTESDLNCGL